MKPATLRVRTSSSNTVGREGRYDRLREMAADLVRRRVAVIVTTGASPSLLAARGATREIPTVLISGEPMQDGIVVSFNRPGRNATGVSLFTKASAPYEFGVKASVVTTNARAPGGQFVLHARTLPGNP